MKQIANKTLRIVLTIILPAMGLLILGWLIGWLVRPAEKPVENHNHTPAAHTQPKEQWYTCSMHPEIRQKEPGLCPKCNMELIPVEAESHDMTMSEATFTTSESALALMNIETSPVELKFVKAEIRMVGKVDYNETRVEYITAWVAGRLDRLYVDYTGVTVNKGDHMAYIYSPELLVAQQELLQTYKTLNNLTADAGEIMRKSAQSNYRASREKLRLLGLNDHQISDIEAGSKPSDHITLYSPAGGIVVHKNVQEGMYVSTGTRIYTIADLSQVWVKLDAYESDLSWLRYGQEVEFTTVSYPGEVFKGTISFIDPVLNDRTRTVKIRVDVPNPQGKLKPEMFVKAMVHANVALGGKVMDPRLAGKWICPMHPSIIKPQKGICDICQMDLVMTESLGYVSAGTGDADKPLVIPVSAALVTGKRAVVYVKLPEAEKPTFEGREIVLGPRAGDYYIVKSGLHEGERVVTRGNFKIDSALQIQAKPSMMSPRGAPMGQGGHQH